MKKELLLFYYYKDGYNHEELWDPSNKAQIVGVSDLSECPEDAIIGRGLLDCGDVCGFIKLGIKYREQGYSSISVTTIEIPEEDDIDEFIEGYISGWGYYH